MSYSVNRAWSDQFIPAIKRIVGPMLLQEASFEVDAKQATDLIVLNARDKRIAARVRRSGYAEKYGYEFTIRSQLDSGTKTELQKIVDGFADWMFYGHADGDTTGIAHWMVIDLSAFRAALIRRQYKPIMQSNGDGTHFVAFDVRKLPSSCIVASSFEIHQQEFA